MNPIDLVLSLAALPSVVGSGYLLWLTVLSGDAPEPPRQTPRLRFEIIVPAHNEQTGITACIDSLLSVDYPKELFRVVVVADNCDDETAARAEAAGAAVLERHDPVRKGKGYALAHAFSRIADNVDAVVVVDADTVVSPNLLRAFAHRIEAGEGAVQADYIVRNPNASWRTRLLAIAFGMFHTVRSRGRERMGVSCGLRGNGMCFTTQLLAAVPHDAFSVVEDIEYGIRLGRHGTRVAYAGEAHVYGEMVAGEKASRTQRQRWEGGRGVMRRRFLLPLLKEALARRSPLLLDLGMDLLIPPLSTLAGMTTVGGLLSVAARLGGSAVVAPWLFGGSLASLGIYVFRGWQVSGTGLRGLGNLVFAPAYIIWKIGLSMQKKSRPAAEWVRTSREAPSAGHESQAS